MGAIQSSINQMLGTAGRAAVLNKALDIIGGQSLATESYEGVKSEAEDLSKQANEKLSEADRAEAAEAQMFQEQEGIADDDLNEQIAMLTEDRRSSIFGISEATRSEANALSAKAVQKQAFAQRLKDISEGKNKVGRRQLMKEFKEGK